jgi:Flp pilus assembly protein TadD
LRFRSGCWCRSEPDAQAVATLVAGYALVLALFFVSSRYRLPLVLLLLPLAADQALSMLSERRQARPVVLALAAMLLLNLPNRFTARFAASAAERGILEATAWDSQGQHERADLLAADLVQRFPHDANVLMLRATQLADEGRCHDAEPLLTRTLALAPRTASPRILLASCYEALGQLGAAERALANALALHPYHPLALRNASLLMQRERRPKEAKALAQRFLASGYDEPRLRRIGGP